jgi:hypothetical protein
MLNHLHLAVPGFRIVFAMGVLVGVFGKKLHGAIVEAGFFKPDLYAHLLACVLPGPLAVVPKIRGARQLQRCP